MTDTTLPDAATMPRIGGYCPMGCGETLHLSTAGLAVCSDIDCPNPSAADNLLAACAETRHIVTIADSGQHDVDHPLIEHADGTERGCDLPAYIGRLPAAVLRPGRYRVRRLAAGMSSWGWERIPDAWDLGDD